MSTRIGRRDGDETKESSCNEKNDLRDTCQACKRTRSRHNIVLSCFKLWLPWIQRETPLRTLGICRRCRRSLYKLKAELQDLGLSRRQVHRGLLQLSTKPRVILTRHTTCRRYGSKQSLEEYGNSIDVDTDRKTDAAFLEHQPRPQDEDDDVQTPDSTQGIAEEESKRDEKMKGTKDFETQASTDDDRSTPSKSCKSNDHRTTTLHSFDKALEQLDCIFSSKKNAEKLNARRTSLVASTTDTKSQNKSHAMNSDRKSAHTKDENQHTGTKNECFELICDKVGHGMVHTADRSKTNRIKLNLKSLIERKRTKPDIIKESDTAIKNTRVQADSATNQKKRVKQDNHETASGDNKATRIEENVCKGTIDSNFAQGRRKRIHASVDERCDARMMKNLIFKFRKYFGDCNSISEDEQEQDILQKRFKRRRKKNSVDSCDSGVCFSDGNNAIGSSGIEILKDIQKAVPDSTMHEISEDTSFDKTVAEADTVNTSKDEVGRDENIKETNQPESVIDNEDKQSQSDTCIVDNNEIIQKKLHGISDENNLVQSTTTLDVAETPSEIEKSNICVSESQETDADNNISSCSTPTMLNPNRETNTTESLSKSEASSSDLKDLSELFQMNFGENCEISSNGNVLSIQEKDTNQNILSKDTNENILFRILTETTHEDCNQNTEQALNIVENNNISLKDKGSSSDRKRNIETVPVKISLSNLLGNTNETILPESKLNDILAKKAKVTVLNSESSNMMEKKEETVILDSKSNDATEKKDETALVDRNEENKNTQPSKVPKIKLRVLSSAELGSRWCPTPVNAVISTTSDFSSTNTVTRSDNGLMYVSNDQVSSSSITMQAVPTTQPVVSTTAPTLASGETTFHNLKRNSKDSRFAKVTVYNALMNIYKLILNTRTSHVDHSKALLREFEKLRKILNTENHVHLIYGVISTLNKQLLLHQPLSLPELLHYIPSFKSLYHPKLINSNGYQNIAPTVVPNKTTVQNTCNYPQGLQSVPTPSVQHVIQNVFSSFTVQSSAPMNVTSEPVQKNFQETMVLQPQNNPVQNNIPMNSAATNCGAQQMNYRVSMQRPVPQQKVPLPNAYFIRQNPVSNIPAQRCIPMQYFSSVPVNNNQSGIRYNQPGTVPVTNSAFIHNYISPINTFCNANASNYTPQQNVNQTQGKNTKNINVPCMGQQLQNTMHRQPAYNMSQGIQPQIPQNIPVIINRSAPTVQNTFVSNTPQSVPRNIQKSEQVYQKVTVQAQTRIPQNVLAKPVPSVQQTQFARRKQNATQISLESTVKQFDILKYLSGIQKIMLLKQMDFYFGCTTWLQQQFTSEQWQVIHSERSLLLHFQTLLKHFVEKTVSELLPNTSQSSMFENNIQISIPKTVQIIVQESEQIHCQVKRSNAEEQCKTANINESNMPRQENTNTSTPKDQSANEPKTTDNASKKQLPSQTQESQISQNEEIQRDKQTERTLIQENQSAVTSIVEISKTSDDNVNEKDTSKKESENSTDLSSFDTNEQNVLPSSIKIIHNALHTAQKEVPTVSSNLKVSQKDTPQQSNPHLVTVTISSHDDKVTVIDTDAVSKDGDENEEIKPVTKETKECEQPEEEALNVVTPPSCSQDNISENSLKFLADIKHLSNADLDNIKSEETTIIADVRSITLEAFEKMEANNNTSASNSEGNIEEEDIKVCLFCGKPSTIACTVCVEAKYCSEECSYLHWEEHYQDCKPVRNSVFIV